MKIGRQIIVSTITYSLSFLLGLLSVKILTSSLSISDYGVYSLIFSTIGIAVIFLGFGFDKYLFTKIPGEEKTKGFSFFTSTYIFELIVAGVITILIIVIGPLLIKHFNLNISYRIVILSALILLFTILVNESLRFHGLRKRLEFKAIMGLLQEKLWILPLFVLWWVARKLTLDQILLIRFLPYILVLFISLWAIKRKGERVGNNKIFSRELITDGLFFGVPLIILDIGDNLLSIVDRYIITFFSSTTAVGYYSLAYSVANIIYGLTSSIIWIFFPYFAEAYNKGKKDNFQFARSKNIFNCSLKLCLVISLFIAIILILLRYPIILLISSKEYLVTAPTMAILSLFPLFLILTYLFHQILLLEKQRRILVKGYIFAPLLNIILNFILIPNFGINGAAVATVVSYFFLFLFFFFKTKRYNILHFSKIQLLKIAICLIAAIIPVSFLNHDSLIEVICTGMISGLIYFFSLVILKVLTKKDWDILFSDLA